jgi:hypothetical protein
LALLAYALGVRPESPAILALGFSTCGCRAW